eukprot:TRINITY_DN774194_c0_g1_i1.p1 TRINITY_DN774194_c0_g1~~TRINITY_DN774194_c0_g1_i1.p1  ORF type:complete len:209 (-),score=44.24 TRINITY_DN774194_c0_g1_i1:114-740(-)
MPEISKKQKFRISKTLSCFLRHRAAKAGLVMDSAGYVGLDDLLKIPNLSSLGATFEIVEDVVKINEKQRFKMIERDGVWFIRANQGHNKAVAAKLKAEDLLSEVKDSDEMPVVVHGTFRKAFEEHISKEGLKTMGRDMIHCAAGLLGEGDVISGMRKNCQIAVYIDSKAAMEAGIKFFISSNGVILSPGNDKGIIPPEFFKEVVVLKH